MSWIFWAILNPIFFNSSNYIEKFLIDKRIKNPVTLTILGGLVYFLVGVCILIPQKNLLIPLPQLVALIIAGILLQFYLLPFYKALALDETSRITPFFEFIPVLSLIMGFFFLGQKLSPQQLMGFIAILMGGFIVGSEKFEKGIFNPRKSMWYMLLACLMYATLVILFQFVVIQQNFWVSFGYKSVGAGLGSLLLFLYPPFRKDFLAEGKSLLQTSYHMLFINQAFIVFGEFAESFALTMASAALVTIVEGTQSIFALITGIILSLWFPHLIKEDLSKGTLFVKILAIAIIIGGVFLIYF